MKIAQAQFRQNFGERGNMKKKKKFNLFMNAIF